MENGSPEWENPEASLAWLEEAATPGIDLTKDPDTEETTTASAPAEQPEPGIGRNDRNYKHRATS